MWCPLVGVDTAAFLNDILPGFVEAIHARPPRTCAVFGLAESDFVWVIQRAVYGLCTSPKAWGDERVARTREVHIQVDGATRAWKQSYIGPCVLASRLVPGART